MFKPVRMERILVGGHRDHMESVIETLQNEGVLHLEDYVDGSGITQMGSPLDAGDEASAELVRVRGLQKVIGAEDTESKDLPTPDSVAVLVDEAEAAIQPVVAHEQELRARLAELRSQEAGLAPLVGLEADLETLQGLDSLRVFTGLVGSDPTAALQAAGLDAEVATHRGSSGLVAVVAVRTAQGTDAERVLGANGFQALQIPAGKGTPRAAAKKVANTIADLESELEAHAVKVAGLHTAWGGRLASIETLLMDEVSRTQAPLQFAVTDNTFHVEAWVPRSDLNALQNLLAHTYGDSLYVEKLGDAPREHEAVAHGDDAAHDDHGHDHHDVDVKDEAPIELKNGKIVGKYQFLLGLLAIPRYRELDPTKLIALFFPLFFGLMVGDLIIGLMIVGVALWLRNHRLFGIGGDGIAKPMMWGGIMAAVIGLFVFGEGLGLHFVISDEYAEAGEHSWETAFGINFPDEGWLHKTGGYDSHGHDAHGHVDTHDDGHGASGASLHAESATAAANPLAPHGGAHLMAGPIQLGFYSKIHDVQALLLWSILIGVVHIVLGLFLGVRNVAVGHGVKLAIQEKVSWLLILAGIGLLGAGAVGGNSTLTWAGIGGLGLGVILLWFGVANTLGDGNLAMGFIAILEVPSLMGNLLSYTRLAAIGASKAGMAIAFATIGFDLIGGPVGIVVYLLAALMITLLAILAGFLQSLRLQFVEFFSKFYEGGGRPYVPFGRRNA